MRTDDPLAAREHVIPMDQYVRDAFHDGPPTLSSHIAHLLVTRSPAHAYYAHPRLHPGWQPEERFRFDLGIAAHAALLEDQAHRIHVVAAEDWRSTAARAARELARAQGKIPLLAHQADAVHAMVREAKRALAASPDLQGLGPLDAEVTLTWWDGPATNPAHCRCRPDWITQDRAIVLSYKTCDGVAEPEAFVRTIVTMGYDMQAAFECAAVEALTGRTPLYVWIAQETEPPYAVALIGLSPTMAALGRMKYRQAVTRWAECLTRGQWPAYPDRICYVDPPTWALMRWEEAAMNDGRDIADQLFGAQQA